MAAVGGQIDVDGTTCMVLFSTITQASPALWPIAEMAFMCAYSHLIPLSDIAAMPSPPPRPQSPHSCEVGTVDEEQQQVAFLLEQLQATRNAAAQRVAALGLDTSSACLLAVRVCSVPFDAAGSGEHMQPANLKLTANDAGFECFLCCEPVTAMVQ